MTRRLCAKQAAAPRQRKGSDNEIIDPISRHECLPGAV
jgi:hypothetical protein